MIYSGVDLIRSSGRNQERRERVEKAPLTVVKPLEAQASQLDDQTADALARFARFMNRERKLPLKRERKHPYLAMKRREQGWDDRGRMLDVFA